MFDADEVELVRGLVEWLLGWCAFVQNFVEEIAGLIVDGFDVFGDDSIRLSCNCW